MMVSSDLAVGAASLLATAASSEPSSLRRLAGLAVQQVNGCSAATVALWRDGEPAVVTSSHPELGGLIWVQLHAGGGPILDALASGDPVSCDDTLANEQWPEYAAAALSLGVRSSITLPYRGAPDSFTLSLFAARPGVMDPAQIPLAELLVAFGGAALAAVSDYDEAQRTAVQLRDAADSRSLVDQAKGILMHALGCSADEALDRMRQVSQRNNMRTTEVAATIIGARAGRTGQAGQAGQAPPAGQGPRGQRAGRAGQAREPGQARESGSAPRSGQARRSGPAPRSGRPGEAPGARR
jgi:ANTAR domain